MVRIALNGYYEITVILDYFAPLDFSNFMHLFTASMFPRWVLNSIIVSCSVAALNVVACSFAGYALAEKYPGSGIVTNLTMVSFTIPGFVSLVPIYFLFVKLGLTNSYLSLILPMAVSPFSVFLMRQFFLSIPKDYKESALLDGCSEWQIVYKIYMPMAKTALVIIAVTGFVNSWNNFLLPLLMVGTSDMKTVSLGIADMVSGKNIQWGQMMAASTLGIIPTIIMFIAFSEAFIKGITVAEGVRR